MLQSNIWLVLTELGYGASLQHYTELIEEEVQSVYNVPKGWKLIAQMPFGKPVENPVEKTFTTMNERLIIKS
jgi:predicted oxidoreductase (fatty acid repression mutant protein)